MFMVDLAVPRDIEPEVGELADVYLYTVDDLQEAIQENLPSRQEAAKEAENIIDIQVVDFMHWVRSLDSVPATAEEYIHESILDPNLFVAPKCPTGPCAPNVMPATLKDALTADEIELIVKYLHGLPNGAYSDVPVAPTQAPTTGADIVRDPTDLPAPLSIREPQTVRVDLEAVEIEGQLADGTTFMYWTFNGAVPGPFLRVRLGDTLDVHMKNSTTSTMNHSVDFHAVTGPGGGAVMTQTKPGERKL